MKAKTSKSESPQRGRGRPRNSKLDALEKELGLSRRRASTILREEVSDKSKSGDQMPPVAAARLRKIGLESQRLEAQIRALKIEAALLEKRLLTADDAIRLFSPAHEVLKAQLSSMPKSLAPRLYGQSQKMIEQTLADWSDAVLAAALNASERACRELKPTAIDEVL